MEFESVLFVSVTNHTLIFESCQIPFPTSWVDSVNRPPQRDSEADVSSGGIEELIRVLKLRITDCKPSIVITVVVNELEISVNVHFKDTFQAGSF